jgi:hypothetical protein
MSHCGTGAGGQDHLPLADRNRRFEFEVKAYIDHLTQAQYRLIATASHWQGNVLDSEQRIQKGLTKGAAKSFKFGDALDSYTLPVGRYGSASG